MFILCKAISEKPRDFFERNENFFPPSPVFDRLEILERKSFFANSNESSENKFRTLNFNDDEKRKSSRFHTIACCVLILRICGAKNFQISLKNPEIKRVGEKRQRAEEMRSAEKCKSSLNMKFGVASCWVFDFSSQGVKLKWNNECESIQDFRKMSSCALCVR